MTLFGPLQPKVKDTEIMLNGDVKTSKPVGSFSSAALNFCTQRCFLEKKKVVLKAVHTVYKSEGNTCN